MTSVGPPIPFSAGSLIRLFPSRLDRGDRHFVVESGWTTKHEAALTAQIVDDGEYFAPRKLRQPGKQGFERAGTLLPQF
jgi:hypothetical protein